MKTGIKVLAVVAVLGLLAWEIKDYVIPTTWRYKITVEIETPEGLKMGSAVREVRAWKNAAKLINPDIAPIEYEVIGEAVVVDLQKRGLLFGLMNEFTYQEVRNAMLVSKFPDIKDYKNLEIGRQSELKKDFPAFVVFLDLNDPKSARSCGIPIMESMLGKGVKLKRIMIEITDDPVTRRVQSLLPWLNQYKGHTGYLGGEQSPPFDDLTGTYLRFSNFVKGK